MIFGVNGGGFGTLELNRVKYSLQIDQGIDQDLHWRPTFSPSCTEFVYPGCWHFDNGATSKFVDDLLEHGGLPHVISLVVHLVFLVDK